MMSSARKSIGERDTVAEVSNISSDDNEDTSESAETYEAARQLEDKKDSQKLLDSTSDADVSNFSSSDSIQTVTEADVDQISGIGSKLQRSPKQNFERIKFKEECKVKVDDNDVSSEEKESKLFVKEDEKSNRQPNWNDIEDKESVVGCSTEQDQMFETGSKWTIQDFEGQVHCRYSPVTISVQDIKSSGSSIAEKSSEVTTKKIISKKSPEKFKKTRLGSSEIAADVIEDAIDHTDDSVFVGASDFITSSSIPNTEIVTDITEDAIDNTDQEVFTKIASGQVYADNSNIISDTTKVTDVTKDLSDLSDETISLPVKFSDFVASSDSNIHHDEIGHTSYEDTEKTVRLQRNSQTLDFQEVISGEIVSVTASTIFSQVSQFESENLSDITAEPSNLQNIDIEKTESTVDSNPSDDRMEFSSASTIQSGLGYNTDTENMECSSDTYSGIESFKIDGESNTTLEKMDCKSESSASRDKMETESLSLKSSETDGMEYSSDAMSSFGQKSIGFHEVPTSVQENEFTSLQEHASIIVEENDSISVQEKESMQVHRNESVVDKEGKSIGVHENQSTAFQENKSIDVSGSKVISVPETKLMSVPETKVMSVQENESIIVHENESSSNQKNESINNQQTAPISVEENNCGNILQQEDASRQLLESVSCLIGDFVSRTIQETVSQHPRESLRSLLDEATVSQVLTDNKCTTINESDSSSNEIKSFYESTIDPNTGSGERNFTIPRQEASDTEEYDYEQKKVSKEVLDKNLSSRSELSLKRRNSAEDEKTGNTDTEKQSTLSIAELPNEDSEELKDSDDKKGHKKLKK